MAGVATGHEEQPFTPMGNSCGAESLTFTVKTKQLSRCLMNGGALIKMRSGQTGVELAPSRSSTPALILISAGGGRMRSLGLRLQPAGHIWSAKAAHPSCRILK